MDTMFGEVVYQRCESDDCESEFADLVLNGTV